MIEDLRSALEELKKYDNQIACTDTEVDSYAEVAGIYRYVGAGGTVKRPTKEGPALLFRNIKGFPDKQVLIGLLASRKRVGCLLDCPPDKLGFLLKDAAANPIMPEYTEEDAGPYITMGMCYASDPVTGEGDVTIHRLCLQSADEMTMFFTPGVRHLDAFREKAEREGVNLPISISIGVDPAIEIASCFEPPTTPLGFNELSIAGALRKKPVRMAKCRTIDEYAIANAEFVIEGELVAGKRMREDINTNTGKAMPEFPGYTGHVSGELPVIKIKAVTHRKNPIIQTCIGPSEEHVSMAGIPTEASILTMEEKALAGLVKNVYAHRSGGGKYMAVIQFAKQVPSDEGRQRQAALIALTAFPELKHVIVVDEDVDIFDSDDVLWALNTRYQGDVDTITIPGVRCHPLDPTEGPEYNPMLKDRGISCKTIFDCTVPYGLKDRFQRSKFKEVNMEDYEIRPLV